MRSVLEHSIALIKLYKLYTYRTKMEAFVNVGGKGGAVYGLSVQLKIGKKR